MLTQREEELAKYFAQEKYNKIFNMLYNYIVHVHFGEKFNETEHDTELFNIIKYNMPIKCVDEPETDAEVYFQKVYQERDGRIIKLHSDVILKDNIQFDFTEKCIDIMLHYLQENYSLMEIIHVAFTLVRDMYLI